MNECPPPLPIPCNALEVIFPASSTFGTLERVDIFRPFCLTEYTIEKSISSKDSIKSDIFEIKVSGQ